MSLPGLQSTTAMRANTESSSLHLLHPRWLLLARGGWLAAALLALGLTVAGIPIQYASLQTLCAPADCTGFGGRLSPSSLQSLQNLGLSLRQYAAITTAGSAAMAAVWFVVALVLFSRRSREPMALFSALMLVLFGAFAGGFPEIAARAYPGWSIPAQAMNALALSCLTIFFFVFPNGRWVPRWMRPGAAVVVVMYAIMFLFPGGRLVPRGNPISAIVEIALMLAGVGIQLYRYRHVSSPVERQQTKWVVVGLGTSIGGIAAILLYAFSDPVTTQANTLTNMILITTFHLFELLIPVSIGVAILRYRLWDVDILINRTLVYGTLTGMLALIYWATIALIQRPINRLMGQESDLAIVASTLTIAALFNPLRRNTQAIIDRRFYRHRYDAARILQDFSTRLRADVDLNSLTEDILGVVEETLQPARVSLWLKAPDSKVEPDEIARPIPS